MKNIFFYLFILLFISNCNLNKVVNHHGIHSLEKKEKNLVLRKTNKNDIIKILGPPSTISDFNKNIWIYLENKSTKKSLIKLGKKDTFTNNVLVLEVNSGGILISKNLTNIDKMKKIKFSEDITTASYKRNDYIYKLLSSMREKMNNPTKKNKRN